MTAPTQGGDERRRDSVAAQAPHKRLSRRDFIKWTTAATAGSYAALTGLAAVTGSDAAEAGCMGGGGGCGGSSSGTPLDPPLGAALLDPQPLRGTTYVDGILSGSISAYAATLKVGGVTAEVLTYNGQYPGPLIQLHPNDKLHLTFQNQLPMGPANLLGHETGETSLHTHGWHVSPETEDNVMRMFMPGEGGPFTYDLKNQEPGTLCWYHPHVHELTAQQVWGGMHGLLLIDDPPDAPASISPPAIEQHVLVLKDISIVNGKPAPHSSMMDYMHGKEGDLVMVNGQLNPVVSMKPGQVQRWRILNASNARFYKLQLQGHSLQVIGTDGGLLDKPYAQSYVLVSPGERLDVLVKASGTTGSFKLLALPYSRMGMMSSSQRTLMTVKVAGTAVNGSVPKTIRTIARTAVDLSKVTKRTFTLSMGSGRGYINGLDFDGPARCTVDSPMSMMEPVYELWTIQNQSNMDHPWHQHVNPAQVMSISGGDSAYRTLYTTTPAWKDVVIVPKMGSITQLVRISDYMGMAMFHCHILEHEDIGMMGIWNIGMEM